MTAVAPEAAAVGSGEVVLAADGITKTYGVTRALKGVDFEIRRGQVTVLFGENGAGKSTLMKILSGVEQPTSGRLVLDGEEVHFASPREAEERGIAIIHQETNLCSNLSVRDNIFLGREVTGPRGVDYGREDRRTREVLDRLQETISPSALVQDLRMGQQQIVEIARALAADARILIMDEPTSALSAGEVDVLFSVIRDLTAHGVAIVYISHHLEEAIEIADRAAVFRDGELVATRGAEGLDLPWVVRTMVGREADYDFRDEERHHGDVVLSVRGVTVADPVSGRLSVDEVSFDVRRGEIVCLFGLMGAGRTELVEALAGRGEIGAGSVVLDGEDLRGHSVGERIERGLGLVPEDRQRDGLVQLLSVGHNLSLAGLGSFVRRAVLSRRAEGREVGERMTQVRVKAAGPEAPITSLSGGNQQKVVIGKLLMTGPSMLLLDEPTRGIDVGAKGEIFSLLFREAERGMAVLFATSELGEAITASHRILVMAKGRIVADLDPRTCTRDEVMAATGGAAAHPHRPDPATNGAPS